eukprot:1053532-Pleurochrysis_carterae.AAC.1
MKISHIHTYLRTCRKAQSYFQHRLLMNLYRKGHRLTNLGNGTADDSVAWDGKVAEFFLGAPKRPTGMAAGCRVQAHAAVAHLAAAARSGRIDGRVQAA